MNRRKSGLFTLLCSLWPGAGEMYLGMMRKGVVIMVAFFGVFFISSLFSNGIFSLFLPVIWFYSFFDTLNCRHMTEEELVASETRFFYDLGSITGGGKNWFHGKRYKWIGIILILFGIYLLIDNVLWYIINQLGLDFYWLRALLRMAPTIFVAIAIIYFGFYLIHRGKDTSSDKKDFIEYQPERRDEDE